MGIFYVLIAKKTNVILCDYTSHTGNFQEIVMQLLNQITPGTAKTLELEDYLFHYIHENGLLCLCMADKDVTKKLAFSFLQDVRQCFLDKHSTHDIEVAGGFGLKSFGNIYMKPKMNFYNENPDCSNDKADELL